MPASMAACRAFIESSSSTVPQVPPSAQAPKLIADTFMSVRPSARYSMGADSSLSWTEGLRLRGPCRGHASDHALARSLAQLEEPHELRARLFRLGRVAGLGIGTG